MLDQAEDELNKAMEFRKVTGHWRQTPTGQLTWVPEHQRYLDIVQRLESGQLTMRHQFDVNRVGAGKFRLRLRRPGSYPTQEELEENNRIFELLKEQPGAEQDPVHGGFLIDIEQFGEVMQAVLNRIGPIAISPYSRYEIDKAQEDLVNGLLDDMRTKELLRNQMRNWKPDLRFMTPDEVKNCPAWTEKEKDKINKYMLGTPLYKFPDQSLVKLEKRQRKLDVFLQKNQGYKEDLFKAHQNRFSDTLARAFHRGLLEITDLLEEVKDKKAKPQTYWIDPETRLPSLKEVEGGEKFELSGKFRIREDIFERLEGEEDLQAAIAQAAHQKEELLSAQNNSELDLPKDVNTKVLDAVCARCDRPKEGETKCTCPEGFKGKHVPRIYQRKGVNWLPKVRRGILGFDTGLGKTITAILASKMAKDQMLKDGKRPGPTIVVAPAKRKFGWFDDIVSVLPSAKVAIVHGGPKERRAQLKLAKYADYVICSYEGVRMEGERLMRLRPSIMINDESHRLKNWGSHTVKSYQGNLSHVPYMFDLTATPFPNRPEEVFTTMRRLNPRVFGDSMEHFKNEFALYTKVKDKGTGEKKEKQVGYQNLDKLYDKMRPYILYRDYYSEDVRVALPPKHSSLHRFDLEPEQVPYFEAILNETLDTLAEEEAKGTLNTHNILTQFIRLEQASIDPGIIPGIAYEGKSAKYEEALDIIAAHFDVARKSNRDPKGVVIACRYVDALGRFKQKLLEAGFKEHEILDGRQLKDEDLPSASEGFRTGRYRVLLMPDKISEGLNLQGNADLFLHLNVDWTPRVMKQRIGRIYRPGSVDPVHELILTVRGAGGIEERKWQKIQQKRVVIDQILQGKVTEQTEEEALYPKSLDEWLDVMNIPKDVYNHHKRGERLRITSVKEGGFKKDRSALVSTSKEEDKKRKKRAPLVLSNFTLKDVDPEARKNVIGGKKTKKTEEEAPIGRRLRNKKKAKKEKGSKKSSTKTKKNPKSYSPDQAKKLLKLIDLFKKAKSAKRQKILLKKIKALG